MSKPVVAVFSQGLRPRTPSSPGSLALARSTGGDAPSGGPLT